MVGSLSAGLLLADEAGAHLPSVDDFLPPEILFQGTPFAINRIILIRIVATIVLLVVLGVTAKRAKLIPGRWQGVVEYGLDFVRDKVVYDVMGEARGKRYVPMITTLFFTIFIFNLCGIIPGMNMESLYIRHDVISERKLARLNPDRPVSFRADQAVSRFGTTLGRCPLGLRSSVTHRHF